MSLTIRLPSLDNSHYFLFSTPSRDSTYTREWPSLSLDSIMPENGIAFLFLFLKFIVIIPLYVGLTVTTALVSWNRFPFK